MVTRIFLVALFLFLLWVLNYGQNSNRNIKEHNGLQRKASSQRNDTSAELDGGDEEL